MEEKTGPIIYQLDMDSCSDTKIKQKIVATDKRLYYILNYDKMGLSFNDEKNTIYRSVVFGYNAKEILCFSPPKSKTIEYFMKLNPTINENMIMNEYMEGVMISLFYDTSLEQWELATKGAVGGKYSFYNKYVSKSDKTFYEMFLEALSANPGEELNNLHAIHSLSKRYSYTFILQHPENKIILPVKKAALYLVGVYKYNIWEYNTVEYIPANEYETWHEFNAFQGLIQFPNRPTYSWDYDELIQRHESFEDNIERAGIVITNSITGDRAVIKSRLRSQLKKNKYVGPEIEYKYFAVRKTGKMNSFLSFYPSYKNTFASIADQYEALIKNVYDSYIHYYVLRDTNDIEDKYFNHIVKIHKTIYIPSFRTTRKRIKKDTVRGYFDKMEPRELLFLLNWDIREMNIL